MCWYVCWLGSPQWSGVQRDVSIALAIGRQLCTSAPDAHQASGSKELAMSTLQAGAVQTRGCSLRCDKADHCHPNQCWLHRRVHDSDCAAMRASIFWKPTLQELGKACLCQQPSACLLMLHKSWDCRLIACHKHCRDCCTSGLA